MTTLNFSHNLSVKIYSRTLTDTFWTVLAIGRAHEITDPAEANELERIGLTDLTGTPAQHYLQLNPTSSPDTAETTASSPTAGDPRATDVNAPGVPAQRHQSLSLSPTRPASETWEHARADVGVGHLALG